MHRIVDNLESISFDIDKIPIIQRPAPTFEKIPADGNTVGMNSLPD